MHAPLQLAVLVRPLQLAVLVGIYVEIQYTFIKILNFYTKQTVFHNFMFSKFTINYILKHFLDMLSTYEPDRFLALKNSDFKPSSDDSRPDHNRLTTYLKDASALKRPESRSRRKVTVKPPSSIVLFPTRELEKDEVPDRKVYQEDTYKFYSSPYHATTCMLYAVVFPAKCPHATVTLKKGARIALQIQFERQPHIHYPEIFPELYSAGIIMNDNDELFIF